MSNDTLVLPLFPLKNAVLFPYLGMPLTAGRPVSIAAIEAAVGTEEKEILVVAQRDAAVQEPGKDDLFGVGTKAVIRRLAPSPQGGISIFVQGIQRVRIGELVQAQPFVKARFEPAPVGLDVGDEVEALEREVKELGTKALALARPDASEIDLSQLTGGEEDRLRWLYILASLMGLEMSKAQELLSADNLSKALALMLDYLQHEVRILELRHDIASKVQTELTKQQREILLRQQMRAIQEELGEETAGEEGQQRIQPVIRDRIILTKTKAPATKT